LIFSRLNPVSDIGRFFMTINNEGCAVMFEGETTVDATTGLA